MDTHELTAAIRAKVDELKQRTDTSAIHDALDAFAEDVTALFAGGTGEPEAAPRPGPGE